MGKNKKARKGASAQLSSGRCMISDSSVCKAIDDLWLLLQGSASEQLVSLWDEYDKIEVVISRLRDLQNTQHSLSNKNQNRAENLPIFEKWLQGHGAVYGDSLEVVECPGMGFGLRCIRDMKRDEKVLQIPENIMMSSQTALAGDLGMLVRKEQMLQSMTNVVLALHLLNEKYSTSSFWKPYIDILPHCFTLPLYFSKQELLLLQGSPCLAKCLLQVRNITKLYAHLHRIIRVMGEPSLPLYKSGFMYDDFIWAVSCVMSRQNEIPSKSAPSPTLALIPLWDLCNHCSGHISTYFNVESSTCDCYAQQDFKANDEFKIFYGQRSNSELLLQQGFVYHDNEFDSYHIKLGLSSMEDEKTRALRLQLLQRIELPKSGSFCITKSKENPFSVDLCAFLRVFTASLTTMQQLISEKDPLEKLRDTNWYSDDVVVVEYLEKRCSLLLAQYPTLLDEDEKIIKDESILDCSRLAVLMRMSEKKLLLGAILYSRAKLEELKQLTHSKIN